MKHEVIERELSARLDGARDARLDGVVEEHLASCDSCRRFENRARHVREMSRLEPAPSVPDALFESIVRETRAAQPKHRPSFVPRLRIPTVSVRYAAAFVAGALVSAFVFSGSAGLRRPSPALASDIPQRIAAASREVTAYRATFEITERNFHELVPMRRFLTRVAFSANEKFRAEIEDLSVYPSPQWPKNSTVLSVDEGRWVFTGPLSCPREGLPSCAEGGSDVRSIEGREPFDGDAIFPSDIVLPIRTLAGSERVQVVGHGTVLGRNVVHVNLTYRDAVPLFAYLHAGGSWRPFFPLDPVVLSLDEQTWFPLAYQVRAASSQERGEWAARNGLPSESSGTVLIDAQIRSFDEHSSPKELALPDVAPTRNAGFRDVDLESLADRVAYQPLLPSYLGGLRLHRAGHYTNGARPKDESLISFARGLAWLKVRQTRSWSEPALYGNVGALATSLNLPDGGLAYYEPASSSLGRRLSIHAPGWDIYLESNLPIKELLRVAGSLPIKGQPAPSEWLIRRWPGGIVREQTTLERARQVAPYLLLPHSLPSGYRLSVVHVVEAGGTRGVTIYFRRSGTELDGIGVRLHQAAAVELPPPVDPDVSAVSVRGVIGRYSAVRNELEWVEGGVYRSVSANFLDLKGLLRIASSLSAGSPG